MTRNLVSWDQVLDDLESRAGSLTGLACWRADGCQMLRRDLVRVLRICVSGAGAGAEWLTGLACWRAGVLACWCAGG